MSAPRSSRLAAKNWGCGDGEEDQDRRPDAGHADRVRQPAMWTQRPGGQVPGTSPLRLRRLPEGDLGLPAGSPGGLNSASDERRVGRRTNALYAFLGHAMATRRCAYCRKALAPRRRWHRFCDKNCRWRGWKAENLKTRHSNKPTFTVENPAAVPAIYLTVDRDKVRRALRRGLVIPGIRPVESDPVAG